MDHAAPPTLSIGRRPGRVAQWRMPHQAVYAILACAALAVAFVGGVSGFHNLVMPVKAGVAILVLLAAALTVLWKPALFPICLYLFAVPFDNFLQTGFGTATKLLGGASIVVVLLLMIDRRRTVTPPAATFAWMAFLLWSVTSLMWSIAPADSLGWLTIVSSLFTLYAIFSLFKIRESEVRLLVSAIVAGGIASAVYGLWMYTHGTVISSAESRVALSLGPHGMQINADHFAGALVLPIALVLVTALRLSGLKKALAFATLLLLLAGVFISGARGGFIAVGAVWLYLTVFYGYGRERIQLIAMGAAGLLTSTALPSVWLRFFDPTQGQAGGRYGIWSVAWEAFRHHWLVGVGIGDFRAAYTEVYLTVYQGIQFHPWAEDSHNLIASTSVELGIIGLSLLAVAWFYQFRAVSVIPRSSSLFDLRLACEAGTIGLFVVAMTADLLWFKYLWIGFMLAVLVRNAYVGERPSSTAAATAIA